MCRSWITCFAASTLTKLCLPDAFSASSNLSLFGLNHVSDIKLGGAAADTKALEISKLLSKLLLTSVTKLDCCDSMLTDLQQVNRLRGLQKLCMPAIKRQPCSSYTTSVICSS